MDATTSYFLKKYYPHVIKWWLVEYNPEAKRVWPSKQEEEEALRLEMAQLPELPLDEDSEPDSDSENYNAATGSYSGLYGQKPVDESTQAALDAILSQSSQSSQNCVDNLLSDNALCNELTMSEEQKAVIAEANAIYERLQREAAEDDAKKLAELELARLESSNN
jgi:hypothetical protein